jgi:hypothetical protein
MNELFKSKSYRIYNLKKSFDIGFFKIIKYIIYLLAISSFLYLVNNAFIILVLPKISNSILLFVLAFGLILFTFDIFIHYFSLNVYKDKKNENKIFDFHLSRVTFSNIIFFMLNRSF